MEKVLSIYFFIRLFDDKIAFSVIDRCVRSADMNHCELVLELYIITILINIFHMYESRRDDDETIFHFIFPNKRFSEKRSTAHSRVELICSLTGQIAERLSVNVGNTAIGRFTLAHQCRRFRFHTAGHDERSQGDFNPLYTRTHTQRHE